VGRFGRGWRDFDLYILITTVVLMGFGAVTIYSADGGGALSPSNLGVRQALYGSIGLVVMFVVASIDYRILGSLAWPAYAVAMLALFLVLIPGIGTEIAGSRRWFDLGFCQASHPFGVVCIRLVAWSGHGRHRQLRRVDPDRSGADGPRLPST
jgi:cell division protein FtsW